MSDLVQVPFHGDVIEAVQKDGKVWVSVRRVCESLGLQSHGQAEKLKTKGWACTQMICVHDVSGRQQDAYCIDLDSLPLWLATIEASRVKAAVREKLVKYQKEAARVLADHFFGRKPAAPDLSQVETLAKVLVPAITAAVTEAIRVQAQPVQHVITVEERLAARWPAAQPKHRRRARDIAAGLMLLRRGEWPLKMGPEKNGQFVFDLRDLPLLDEAIDRMIEEATRSQMAPLFMQVGG